MSRKQSAFLAQIAETRRAAQEAARKTYMQYLTDTAVIALSEKFGFGKDRIQAFLDEWGKQYDVWYDALRTVEESDYYRAKLDERLQMLSNGENFAPFNERYQFLPDLKY